MLKKDLFLEKTSPHVEIRTVVVRIDMAPKVPFGKNRLHRVRRAAEGGIFAAWRTGAAVVARTTNHPNTNTPTVEVHGNEKATPSSAQRALYNMAWKPYPMSNPLSMPKTATQETSVENIR